jgi:nucleotidyltransferase substrate binding protein (TIGR01987 family)
MEHDIRWEQRFSNYKKALAKLSQSIHYINDKQTESNCLDGLNGSIILDEMVKEALIQRFEYTHELAWNVMKDYAIYQGNTTIGGSRDATREGFQLQLFENGSIWMDMIGSQNKTSHTYNEDIALEIYIKIINDYYPAFIAFEKQMETKKQLI